MGLSLEVARKVLRRLSQVANDANDPKDLKIIAEANKIAVETIRRIRGLDDVSPDATVVIDRSYGARQDQPA